jgi:hypothetical protein
LGFELIFDVVLSADFEVCFTPVVELTFDVVFDVPGILDAFKIISLIVFYIIDRGVLLSD